MRRDRRFAVVLLSVVLLPVLLAAIPKLSDGWTAFREIEDRGTLTWALGAAWNVERVTPRMIYTRGPDGEMDVLARAAAQTDTPWSAFPAPTEGSGTATVGPARGWGASALTTCNSANTHMIEVTSTAFSGQGTWSWAWATADTAYPSNDLKIIYFSTGGWAAGNYQGNADCTYLAAQTSPGGGFGKYFSVRHLYLNSNSNDVVIRGLTLTGQARNEATSVSDVDIDDMRRFVWANNSSAFSTEHPLAFIATTASDTSTHLSIIYSVFSSPNSGGGTIQPTLGQYTNGEAEDSTAYLAKGTFARNLWKDCHHRCPAIGPTQHLKKPVEPNARVIGNLYQNSGEQFVIGMGGRMDAIDNHHKIGPATNYLPGTLDYSWTAGTRIQTIQTDSTVDLYVCGLTGAHNKDPTLCDRGLWWSVADENSDGIVDTLQAEVACPYKDCRDPEGGGNILDSIPNARRLTAETVLPEYPFPRITSTTLEDSLIGDVDADIRVGANFHVQCDGQVVTRVDSLLSALAQEVRDSTGISTWTVIDSSFVAARQLYPKDSGTPCTDADGDDLPDAFESRHWGNTTSTNDPGGDPDGDGYSNGWEWVDGTDPLVFDAEPGGGGGTAGTTTYGDGRIIHLVPAAVDTHITGGGADTVVRTIPDPDSVPIQGICIRIPDPDTSHYYAVTYDTLSPQPLVLDSAAAGDSMASLGTDRDIRTDPCFGH